MLDSRLARYWRLIRQATHYLLVRVRFDSPLAWLLAYEFHLRLRSDDAHSEELFHEFFSLLGKLLFAGERLGPVEVNGVHDVLRRKLGFGDARRNKAIKIINHAKHDARAPREIAKHLNALMGKGRQSRLLIADIVYGIAFSNGVLGRHEQYVSTIVFQELGLPADKTESIRAAYAWRVRYSLDPIEEQFERARERWRDKVNDQRGQQKQRESQEKLIDNCYRVLGCETTDSNRTIKKRYRQLIKELHPDHALGPNPTPDEIEAVEARFREVQEAYEEVQILRPGI